MMIRNAVALTGMIALVLFVLGCEQKPTAETAAGAGANAPSKTKTASLPADLFTEEAPEEARPVGEIKADADADGDVVIHGRIGGTRDPFVDGAAVFLLADTSMKPCNELHGDSCPTPWDYCCEPRESLAAKVATIQVVDEAGKPLRVDLDGKHGLLPLTEITVAGEIASREGGNLVVNAKRIYVNPNAG